MLRYKRAGRPGEAGNAAAISQVLFNAAVKAIGRPLEDPVPDSDRTHLAAEITAALIWDLPALRGGSDSAQNFAKALERELDKWWEPRRYGPDPLGRAQAVASERDGERGRLSDGAACGCSNGHPGGIRPARHGPARHPLTAGGRQPAG